VFPYDGELVTLKLPFAEDTHNTKFYQRLIRSLSLIRQLRTLKKKKNIDVAISFMEASNFANIISRRKEKTIISIRAFLSHEFKDDARLRIFRTFIRKLYKKADEVVVPATMTRFDLINNFHVPEQKISVIYNFTDKTEIGKLSMEDIPAHHEKIFSQYPVIINVGRITNAKSQWALMPVMEKVKLEIPKAKLVILGDGPLKSKVLEAAEAAKLRVYIEGTAKSENMDDYDIYLLGFIMNPYPYFRRAHLFIKSSIYEGFPNVMIEAMSCSLPVISSDCHSGPREILSPASDQLITATENETAEYGILTPIFSDEETQRVNYISETSSAVISMLTDQATREYFQSRGANIKIAIEDSFYPYKI